MHYIYQTSQTKTKTTAINQDKIHLKYEQKTGCSLFSQFLLLNLQLQPYNHFVVIVGADSVIKHPMVVANTSIDIYACMYMANTLVLAPSVIKHVPTIMFLACKISFWKQSSTFLNVAPIST